jgi:hypothetical protein
MRLSRRSRTTPARLPRPGPMTRRESSIPRALAASFVSERGKLPQTFGMRCALGLPGRVSTGAHAGIAVTATSDSVASSGLRAGRRRPTWSAMAQVA